MCRPICLLHRETSSLCDCDEFRTKVFPTQSGKKFFDKKIPSTLGNILKMFSHKFKFFLAFRVNGTCGLR
jgi:hypothetical protein